MSITRALDVAFVRFCAPDIAKMHRFLTDFGMRDVEVSQDKLFMRGYGTSPFVHATQEGEPGFAGFGIWVPDECGLEQLAAHDGAVIEPLDAPGGGRVVRLTDPDGFSVEAVSGQRSAEPLDMPALLPWNQGEAYPRQSKPRRVERGASHVRRLGHVVLGVSNFERSEAWYKERFGFVTSDAIEVAPGVAIGAFLRCNRSDQPCDHHTLFLLQRPTPPGFMHAAFEVADLDDLMAGHDHLVSQDHEHFWGVGRHLLGSQVFDYWKDPWGHEIEHWTDGDQLVAADGGGVGSISELMEVQWGMNMPAMAGKGAAS